MDFHLSFPIKSFESKLNYKQKLLFVGSCFAENMGEKFSYFKFQNTVNPFGIIFNPVSIEKLLERVVNQSLFTEKDIFFHNDLWHCYEVHSQLSNPDKNELLTKLNILIDLTNKQISEATHVLVTLGTSWVYRLRQAQSDHLVELALL